MSTKVKKYPNGGEVDPNDPKQLAAWNALKQKYAGELPKIRQNGQEIGALDKRMDWIGWAKQALPTSGTPAQIAAKAAKATGYSNPGLLLASSMEEGIGMRFKGDDAYSMSYDEAKIDQKAFPVDGFRAYGLDQIGGRADEFIKKGYLPKDFKNKMKTFDASNENDEQEYYGQISNIAMKNKLIDANFKNQFVNKKTGAMDVASYYEALDNKMSGFKGQLPQMKRSAKTAAFVDDESAMMAKAAFMRAEQESVLNYAKQKGYKLTPEEQDFFTLASYNGGAGNGQQMLDYYGGKKLLGNNGFLKEKMDAKGQIYDNIMPRFAGGKMFNNEKYFEEGGRIKYEDGTEDPITGEKPKPQLQANPNSIFGDSGQGFPSRTQQEGDLQIIPVGGEAVKGGASPIVPLSQFYDKATDAYGNTVFNGTGKYVDASGNPNILSDQQAEMNMASANNLAHANEMQNKLNDAEKISSIGISAINAFFNKKNAGKQERTNLRKAILGEQSTQFINPYSEGTGSQAIMEKGGRITSYEDGGNLKSYNPKLANKDLEFQTWYKKNTLEGKGGIPYSDKMDYDYYSFFKNGLYKDRQYSIDNHFPDTFKRPGHPTFSNESIYSTPENPGGYWVGGTYHKDGKYIMKNGGEIQGDSLGIQTLDGGKSKLISSSDHSNPMVEFQGKTHDEGGIGIQYGQAVAEVEDKEIGWIDNEGGLNIFGKLKVPGTNKTFRKTAKEVAEHEAKVDGNKSKYLNILNNSDMADPYQKTAQSTAKVMFKSLDKQSKEIAEKKEALASYQNLILSMSNHNKI